MGTVNFVPLIEHIKWYVDSTYIKYTINMICDFGEIGQWLKHNITGDVCICPFNGRKLQPGDRMTELYGTDNIYDIYFSDINDATMFKLKYGDYFN